MAADVGRQVDEPQKLKIEPCPACDQAIFWAMDGLAKRIPVDVTPSTMGTLSLSFAWDGQPRVRKPSAKLAFGRTDLRTPHLQTCTRPRVLRSKTGI